MIYRFFTCHVCQLLKDTNDGIDRCRSCGLLQCNDCETYEIIGTKITISCAKCGAFIGSGKPDYMSDADKEKLR